MKTSWRRFYRRVAGVCLVGAATAWSAATSYADQLAFDTGSNAAYNDGWQGAVTNLTPPVGPGDNGGFGFTPWNFDNDIYGVPVIGIRSMDGPPTAADPTRTQSPFNQVGASWRLGLHYNETGASSWKDIVNVGRGLASPLQVGRTISVVIDPPSENAFFDIETVRFNTGGATQWYGSTANVIERFRLRMFNWIDFQEWGRWSVNDVPTSLWLVDKAPGEHPDFPQGAAGTSEGLRIDFTLTGLDSYSVTLTPLDQPASAFTTSGLLDGRADFDNSSGGVADGRDFLTWQRNFGKNEQNSNPDPVFADGDANGDKSVWVEDYPIWVSRFGGGGGIDWIEFEHYGRPTPEPDRNGADTDFFIRSMEITGPAVSAVPEPSTLAIAAAAAGLLGRAAARRRTAVSRNA